MEQLHYLLDNSAKRPNVIERKLRIAAPKTQIVSTPLNGAASLIFSALNEEKAHSFLYIDFNDRRVDKERLETHLATFCAQNELKTLAIENFDASITLPDLPQIIVTTTQYIPMEGFETLYLLPFDFEEFLVLDNRYDTLDNALSHFIQIGGFPQLIQVAAANRTRHLQELLQLYLKPLELDILTFVAKQLGDKLSVFQIFERLKKEQKLSKDHFYTTFYRLIEQGWLVWLEKYAHPKATKKLYLIDFAIKGALSFSKNFSQIFETLIFLELKKVGKELYYDEHIEFYLPQENRVVLTMPFGSDKALFTLMEKIEGWLISHGVEKLEVVTMSSEAQLHHPFLTVEMIPFTRWALIES